METTRLRFERITSSHVEDFHAIYSLPIAARWSSRGVCKTIDESASWLSGILKENNPEGENYAIFILPSTPSSNQFISILSATEEYTIRPTAMVGIVGTHRSAPVAELGYMFHPAVWGKGYATEAVRWFLKMFWDAKPGVDVIEAKVDSENAASRRVMRKCGFVEEEVREGAVEMEWMVPKRRNLVVYRIRRNYQ